MMTNKKDGAVVNGLRIYGSNAVSHPHAYAIDMTESRDVCVVRMVAPDGRVISAGGRGPDRSQRLEWALELAERRMIKYIEKLKKKYPWALGDVHGHFVEKERTDNMGTDIHMRLECYDKGFCKWHCVETIDVGRDYELFGLLAGVRGTEFDCQIDPRGLPGDVSPETVVDYDGDHTPSFIYGDELLKMNGKSVKKRLSKILKTLKKYPGQPPERMRIVFWFDS